MNAFTMIWMGYATLAFFLFLAGCVQIPESKKTIPDAAVYSAGKEGESRDECLKAIRRARTDARAGIYRLYVFRHQRQEEHLARFLSEYMQAKYGIELVIYGAEEGGRDRCYSNEMEKIIMNRFGPGVMSDAEEEARVLFGSPGR